MIRINATSSPERVPRRRHTRRPGRRTRTVLGVAHEDAGPLRAVGLLDPDLIPLLKPPLHVAPSSRRADDRCPRNGHQGGGHVDPGGDAPRGRPPVCKRGGVHPLNPPPCRLVAERSCQGSWTRMPPTAKPKKAKSPRRGVLDLPKAIEERLAEGRAERESVPLEAHGEWATPDDRPDPVGIIEKQNATRVPELVPIRHGRMIVSPFTFYRGTAAIMASDLSRTPDDGVACPVLRRCAPVELRALRGAGSPTRLRSQRLRRDAAGAVRVGRQAPGGERRRRRP